MLIYRWYRDPFLWASLVVLALITILYGVWGTLTVALLVLALEWPAS